MRKSTLANGMTIITHNNENSKVCTLAYLIKAGSYDELDNEHGIAHLVEHLLFKGTINRDYLQINKDIESVGGYLNAHTSFQHTKYFCTVPFDKWQTGLDVLSDVVFNNTIPEEEFDKEKKVVQEELKMYTDDAGSFVTNKLFEEIFINHENRRSIGGTINSVEQITREDVLDFITRNYFPSNIVLIANGNVDHDAIVKFADEYMKNLNIDFVEYQKGYDKFKKHDLNYQIKKLKRSNIEQTYLSFGMFGPDYNHEDITPIELLTMMLGGNSSSFLFDTIREQRGLAYTISTGLEKMSDVSVICGYAGLNNDNDIEHVIADITDIILNVKSKITEDLLESTKAYVIGMLYLSVETTSNMNLFLAEKILYNDDMNIESQIEKINNVTIKDINRVIDKYIKKENLLFVSLSK